MSEHKKKTHWWFEGHFQGAVAQLAAHMVGCCLVLLPIHDHLNYLPISLDISLPEIVALQQNYNELPMHAGPLHYDL